MADPVPNAAEIRADIDKALATTDVADRSRMLEEIALAAFLLAYAGRGQADDEDGLDLAIEFAGQMRDAVAHTVPDGTDAQRDRVSDIFASAANSAAQRATLTETTATMRWNTQRDDRVRDIHTVLDGVTVAAGETFLVAGTPTRYPGEPVGPPENWINCRCYLTAAPAVVVAAGDAPTGAVVVARVADPHALVVPGGLPADELHVTLGYFGDAAELDGETRQRLTEWAKVNELVATAKVSGVARMGSDDPPAVALLIEAPELALARQSLEAAAMPDLTHPHFTPHLTLGYGIDIPTELPETIELDQIELWLGDETITAAADVDLTPPEGMITAVARALGWIGEGKQGQGFESATATRARKIATGKPLTPAHVRRIHSYFARHAVDKTEGWNSGEDGFPTPGRVAWDAWGGDAGASWSAKKVEQLTAGGDMDDLTAAISEEPWSKWSASDYSIEQWRRACTLTMPGGDPESKSTYKLPIRTPSGALSRAGVHAAASRFGQTDAPAEAKAEAKAKIRGAYSQLKEEPPDSLKADATEVLEAAPGTRDGPGWLTNPEDTQRLRNYWTKGAGAGKIGWGSPGDLTRCHKFISKYVAPGYAWGTCQNLHKEALGIWNPESRGRRGDGTAETDAVHDAFAAAAMLGDVSDDLPPMEWFTDPGFDAATPLTISDDGRIAGHLATWGTCHVGITGDCTEAPKSEHDYAYFRTGEVVTAGGPVPVGNITMNTGHATTDLDPTATVRHYDDTGTVVADVAAGEDAHGIWVAGMIRPGVADEQVKALRAGALSGDWRRIGGHLELVAALAVNVPGFPIPRTAVAASAGRELALVAAGVVVDPNAMDYDRITVEVMGRMARRQRNSERLAALQQQINGPRVEAVLASVAGVED